MDSVKTAITCIFVPLNVYVYHVSGQQGQVSQLQQYQQPEPELPSNSQANSKNEPDVLPPPDSVCEALSQSAADCSSDRLRDDRDDAGRTAGLSGGANQSVPEHEEGEEDANWDGCDEEIDTRGSRGAQTADRAAGSEDGEQSAEEPQDGGQTADRAEAAGSLGVEDRRKTEPLVPQALIPTQTAAAKKGDMLQVVDLGDAGGGGGGDTEQMQPTGSPDVGGDTQPREEANGKHQMSPGAGEGTSEKERQLVEASAAPRHDPDNRVTAEVRAAQSDGGDTTEFSTSAEEDKAASGSCWFPLSLEMIAVVFFFRFDCIVAAIMLIFQKRD